MDHNPCQAESLSSSDYLRHGLRRIRLRHCSLLDGVTVVVSVSLSFEIVPKLFPGVAGTRRKTERLAPAPKGDPEIEVRARFGGH
jgi:hypothetical protein